MTLILHDRKMIVIKTRKTGSQTLSQTLWHHLKETGESYERLLVDESAHVHWWKIKERFKDYDKYEKVACVRNPWDTVVSMYYYEKSHEDMSFRKWITSTFVPYRLEWMPTNMIFDNGKCVCDTVIKCENIVEDIKAVFNIDPVRYGTQHENKGVNRKISYKEAHDDYTSSVINLCCNDEIQEFGYEY